MMDFAYRSSCLLACVLAVAFTHNPIADDAMESNESVLKQTLDEVLYDKNETNKIFMDMSEKLEKVLNNQGSCYRDEASPKQCIDLVSGRSVLTQLCDRIGEVETRLNRVARKVGSSHNSNNRENSLNADLQSLRGEIAALKRSSVFYASRRDKISNFTEDRVTDYKVRVNKGVGFNPFQGVFKAPFEGIYHFSLSYTKNPELTLNAFLVVDSVVIATAEDDQQAYTDVMTSLQEGQEVWTDISANDNSGDSPVSLTFSGYFIE